MDEISLLWLRPSTGDNVSVRRERIAEKLRERGHTIDIVDTSGLDAIGAIKRALVGNYDIIAGNVRIGLYLGYPLARLLRTKFLGDVSDPIYQISDLPTPLYRLLEHYEWFALKHADATVFVYQSSYEEANKRGIDGVRLPNAVDYELFDDPPDASVRKAEQELVSAGVNLKKPIGMYIGSLNDRYNIIEIANAAQHVPDWEFVFIGDGARRDAIDAKADKFENIHSLGQYEYELIPGFLQYARAGFCLVDAEQPLKLKEYGAAGVPIIACPGELSAYYTSDQLLFVEPESHSIANALEGLGDNIKYNQYITAGQEIGKNWSWAEIAEEYSNVCQYLVCK